MTTSPANEVQLRKVLPGVTVDRISLRKRWQNGELVGMFNIPDENVFNACADFCEQTNADETLITFTELNALRQRATRGWSGSSDLFSLVDENGVALQDTPQPVVIAATSSSFDKDDTSNKTNRRNTY